MCIIQGVIDNVSDTRIMAAPFRRRKKRFQLTVYENKVAFGGKAESDSNPWSSYFMPGLAAPAASEKPVAMILPFPNGTTCNLVDLSGYPEIFDDLNKVMEEPTMASGLADSFSLFSSNSSKLDVLQVGSYKVSVATSLEELSRLDFDLFELDPDVQKVLEGNYPSHFGFVVCMMDHGADFHPIAYIHQVKEKMFIPTYHFHDHGNGNETNLVEDPREVTNLVEDPREVTNLVEDPREVPDWDHEIYILNPHRKTIKSMVGPVVRYGDDETMGRLANILDFDRLPYVKPEDFKDIVQVTVKAPFSKNVDFIIPINVSN